MTSEEPAPRFLDPGSPVTPSWPAIEHPPSTSPNILVVLTDDVAFGASSTFGGPIATPTLDRLANEGLRYTRFHTTALCSPTRGALLTGRNPNTINLGNVTNLSTGFEGFNSVIPDSAATVADLLRQAGYATAMFGKSHLTPEWEQSAAGPFDRWPTGLGFDYFYGFLNADTSQWEPSLVENTRFLEPTYDDPNYFLERDMADRAIDWIGNVKASDPARPFLVYYAPGTAHAPHHAPAEWIERYRGAFDHGWDQERERTFTRQRQMGIIPMGTRLTPRPEAVPAWETVSPERRRIALRFMEAYAGAITYLDAQVGRLLDALEASGELDNTLVVFIQGDNGSSAEGGLEGTLYEQSMINIAEEPLQFMLDNLDEIGGPRMYNNIPVGWAWAMSTPHQWYKQVASHFGGMRNGMVISWPARIKQVGGIREQFHFVTDVMPTVLAAAGVTPPVSFAGVMQQPIDGIDMTYSFDDPAAPGRRTRQAFSMMQHLGYYEDDWFVNTTPLSMPWQASQRRGAEDGSEREWELYHLGEDFSQAVNLADSLPEKLSGMQEAFWAEAARTRLLPIHSSYGAAQAGRPSLGKPRTEFAYLPGTTRISQDAAPDTVGRGFTITAELDLDDAASSGVILAQGGRFSGFSLYLDEGRPVFHYNAMPWRRSTVAADEPLRPGKREVSFRFVPSEPRPGAGGTGTLSVDGAVVAEGPISHTLFRWISHTEGLDVGRDSISPVSDDYNSPAVLPSGLRRVRFTID
ncbi:MAG: arylsulfatase [Steroidobacteraceae bacterium]